MNQSESINELAAALARLQTAQDDLVRSERLAALGLLSGGVGHELRNPLGALRMSFEAACSASPEDYAQKREIEVIAKRQIDQLDQMLACVSVLDGDAA